MVDLHLPQGRPGYSHTLRVTFAYDAMGVSVVQVQRVAMRVPVPATPPPTEKSVGYWLAVEDAAGNVLYHVPLHDPLGRDHEVFDDPKRGKPFRAPSKQTSGQFEVLIPDLPAGARAVLHGPPMDSRTTDKGGLPGSVALARHDLAELRRRSAAGDRAPGSQPPGGRP